MAATKAYDECYFINYDSCTDLQLYEIGSHACLPSHFFGPAIRPHYIFHYLTGGKGCLTIENKTYTVNGHEGFLIPPNVLSYYIADQQDPWHYTWIHLDGPRIQEYFQVSGLNTSSPVFIPSEYPNNMASIMEDFLSNHDRELYCIGKTFEFFDCLRHFSTTEAESTANYKLAYIKKIIGYIHVNYSIPFHMDALAKACGLERSYMTRLFKNATGSTPPGIFGGLPHEAGPPYAGKRRFFHPEHCICGGVWGFFYLFKGIQTVCGGVPQGLPGRVPGERMKMITNLLNDIAI